MKIKQDIELSNYVHVVERNIKTKEIISEQSKKNIVLHQGMRKWLTGFQTFNFYHHWGNAMTGMMGISFAGYVYIGVGVGTPAKTDTTLFSEKIRKMVTRGYSQSTFDVANKSLSIKQKATLLSTELNGQIITEVGIGGDSTLSTKVMLDNPIEKTDVKEIEVTYTITLRIDTTNPIQTLTMLGHPFHGDPTRGINGLFTYMNYYSASRGSSGAIIQLGQDGKATNINDFDFYRNSSYSAVYSRVGTNFDSGNFTGNNARWISEAYTYNEETSKGEIKYNFKMNTLSCQNKKIKEIAMCIGYYDGYGSGSYPIWPIFRMSLPCIGVFEKYDFVDVEQINTYADTITLKRNNNIWNEIIAESETIKVNGVSCSKDIDYTINYIEGRISWINKPLETDVITVSWSVPYIPKDELIEFTFNYILEFKS